MNIIDHKGGILMKTFWTCLIIGMGLCVVLSLPGFAQQRRLLRMSPFYDFGLTSEQINKIEEMELKFQQEVLPFETDLEKQYLELRRMIAQNEKQAKIDAKFDRIDKLEIELDQRYQTHRMKIRGLLTDEQKMLYDQQGGFGMGLGLGYGRGYGQGYSRGYGPGYDRGYDRYYGRGYGPGLGRGYGPGYGREYGLGYDRGYGLGYGRGFVPYYDRGYKRDYGLRYGQGYSRWFGRGFGRAWGRGFGLGRGYWCPWHWR
jgi:hypothetical protein